MCDQRWGAFGLKILILAAGYATRLYPLTRKFPKALLRIGTKPLLDHVLDSLSELPDRELIVITNALFANHFAAWCPPGVRLIVNESTSEHDRLGAVGDLLYGLRQENATTHPESCLVVAADNLLPFSLFDFWSEHQRTDRSLLCAWHNVDPHDRERRGNVEFSAQRLVRSFNEKPSPAPSEWSTAPLYAFKQDALELLATYLDEGGNRDAPGHFVEWLVSRRQLAVWCAPESPVDIGTHETLARARQRYGP